NLDDDGFLDATTEDIAAEAGVSPDVALVERVLACVQGFDPAGIAARDRAESFVLQLRRRGLRGDSLPIRLLRVCLSALVPRPLPRIADALGASPENVRDAARLVARLDPSPGRRPSDLQARVVPDVTVDVRDGEVMVRVNEEGVPRLRVCDVRPIGAAAREWRRSAEWLLAALAQRRETLHAVTTSIMRAQHAFLTGTGPL